MNDPASKLIWESVAEGRVAGRFPEQGSSPWAGGVCSEILSLPCFCCWLVSCVFFFYSEFIEGFAGRAPSAITFKTATWSTVAVRKATLWKWHGGTQLRISSLSLLFLCNENLNLICNFPTPFYNVSAPHPPWGLGGSSHEVPGKASGTSHLLCGIHFFPAFFSKEKLISLTQRKTMHLVNAFYTAWLLVRHVRWHQHPTRPKSCKTHLGRATLPSPWCVYQFFSN